LEESDLDLIVSGNKASVLMVEGFARELPEDQMAEAIKQAHDVIRELCEMQLELMDKAGAPKAEHEIPEGDGLVERLTEKYYDQFKAAKQTEGKQARADAVSALKEQVVAEMIPDPEAEDALDERRLKSAWHDVEAKVVRDLILAGTRADGRDLNTVRDICCEVDLLPRTHGSAVFQRGETQALVTVTLGTSRDEQRVDGLVEEYSKKFMLDYNFPPFSVGEVRPIRGPGRREIGHGALAERSVKPVLPGPEDFPYTTRVISEILESNGSSSMASVCGATLALMAAGVPITNPVAGISIGLVKESDEKWSLLTDILGDEDHFGDMDFKIAGTQNGITGIQLDLKIDGISEEIIRATLEQSRLARIDILRSMLSTIRQPRPEISAYAPRLLRTEIEPDKIGMLIGPGGKTIRGIQDETGVDIDVDDDGVVTIASTDAAMAKVALAKVEALTAKVEVGRIYDGRVTSIKDFGAFVEILPGRDGLCHISEFSNDYVSKVSEFCRLGDELKVKVIAVDEQNRVKLSHRQAAEELGFTPSPVGGGGGDGDSDRRDDGGRGDSGGRGRRRER
jgi:polyribonucleotide nucleotidyltransferase